METYRHHISGFYAVRADAETAQAELIAQGLPRDRVLLFDADRPTAGLAPREDSNAVLNDVLVDGSIGTAVGAGLGGLTHVALVAANVSLFVASPVLAPLVMLGRVDSAEQAMAEANASDFGLTAGFFGAEDEVAWFLDHIEAGVTYVNRPLGATTGAWPGYQPFGGWKGSGSTGKALASFHYLPQYMREQSQTRIEP